MQKRTLLVSGSNGNLGLAVAQHFVEHGWNVIGLVHQSNEYSLKADLYHEFEINLLDETAVDDLVKKLISDFDTIDAAVFTAGGFAMGTIETSDFQEIEKMIQLNFKTAYTLTRPLVAHFKEKGNGMFFFIGSMPGMDTNHARSVVGYALSKSLLFNLANIINAEEDAGRAFVVVPTTIDTPQNRKAVPNADFSKWEKPAEIAEIIKKYVLEDVDRNGSSTIIVKDELGR